MNPPASTAGAPPGASTSAVSSKLLKAAVALATVVALFVLIRQVSPWATPHLVGFLDWIDSLGIWAPVVFIIGYLLLTVALIPGSLLTMAGGVLFGLAGGTLYVAIGATLGASAAFLLARHAARHRIERKLEGNERFALIDRAVGEQGLKIVFLLRLVPFFPFVWLNYGLGLTRVRFRDYLLACAGMLPGTFLYVYYGKAIGSLAALAAGQQAEQGAERWVVLGLGLAAAVAVTAVISRIASRALRQATEAAKAPAESPGHG